MLSLEKYKIKQAIVTNTCIFFWLLKKILNLTYVQICNIQIISWYFQALTIQRKRHLRRNKKKNFFFFGYNFVVLNIN